MKKRLIFLFLGRELYMCQRPNLTPQQNKTVTARTYRERAVGAIAGVLISGTSPIFPVLRAGVDPVDVTTRPDELALACKIMRGYRARG